LSDGREVGQTQSDLRGLQSTASFGTHDRYGKDQERSEKVQSNTQPPLVCRTEKVSPVLEVHVMGVLPDEPIGLVVGSDSREAGESMMSWARRFDSRF
jgi:hypothetical protein